VASGALMGQSASVNACVPGGIQRKPLRGDELERDIADLDARIAANDAQFEGVDLP
jgi:hypothetical protein